MMTSSLPWRDSHRIRLHHFANDRSSIETSFIAPDIHSSHSHSHSHTQQQGTQEGQVPLKSPDQRLTYKRENMTMREMTEFFFDISLSGEPIQCSEDDGTCADMRSALPTLRSRKVRES
jgi:beta-1,2-xylosyltransferase